MTAYLIVDTEIIDQKAYEDYKNRAKPIVESYGGEYLVRGGNTTVLENELWTPTRVVVVKFPSRETAQNFLSCDEYAPVRAIRNNHSKTTMIIVDGF